MCRANACWLVCDFCVRFARRPLDGASGALQPQAGYFIRLLFNWNWKCDGRLG